MKNDAVNHPKHYTSGGIECIDAIKASMTAEEFKGYLKGCALKYMWRYRLKGKPVEDLEKAMWYIDLLHKELNPQKKPLHEDEPCVHLKSPELCSRCFYQGCSKACDICEISSDGHCLCLYVFQNTPCPFFKEGAE